MNGFNACRTRRAWPQLLTALPRSFVLRPTHLGLDARRKKCGRPRARPYNETVWGEGTRAPKITVAELSVGPRFRLCWLCNTHVRKKKHSFDNNSTFLHGSHTIRLLTQRIVAHGQSSVRRLSLHPPLALRLLQVRTPRGVVQPGHALDRHEVKPQGPTPVIMVFDGALMCGLAQRPESSQELSSLCKVKIKNISGASAGKVRILQGGQVSNVHPRFLLFL